MALIEVQIGAEAEVQQKKQEPCARRKTKDYPWNAGFGNARHRQPFFCAFSNAANCSGVASFWYFAFHSAKGMP